MKTAAILVITVFFLSAGAVAGEAKRGLPERLEPENVAIVYDGTRYVPSSAYVDKDRKAFYVEAWDVETGEMLWKEEIYVIRYKKTLEHDVQDILIKKLSVEGSDLVIENESQDVFRLDRTTRIMSSATLTEKPRISEEEALQIAQDACERKGWEWTEVRAFDRGDHWEVRTNALSDGGNAVVLIDMGSGRVIKEMWWRM